MGFPEHACAQKQPSALWERKRRHVSGSVWEQMKSSRPAVLLLKEVRSRRGSQCVARQGPRRASKHINNRGFAECVSCRFFTAVWRQEIPVVRHSDSDT